MVFQAGQKVFRPRGWGNSAFVFQFSIRVEYPELQVPGIMQHSLLLGPLATKAALDKNGLQE